MPLKLVRLPIPPRPQAGVRGTVAFREVELVLLRQTRRTLAISIAEGSNAASGPIPFPSPRDIQARVSTS
jgi:hypothetical protein